MSLWGKLSNIDRKWIYALTLVVVIVPLLKPLALPLSVSDEVVAVYERIKALPPGAKVYVGFDYAPAALGELQAQALAVLKILALQDARIVVMTHIPESAVFPDSCTKQVYGQMGKTYGTDYVNLGYFAGQEPALAAFCENPRAVFQADYYDAPLDTLPLMDEIQSIQDFDLVIDFNDGTEQWWIRQVSMAYKKPLILGVQAIMGPSVRAHLQSGAISGLMIGLQAGAEIEKIGEVPGMAIAAMDALSMGHLAIAFLIIVGNIGYLVTRKPKNGDRSGEGELK